MMRDITIIHEFNGKWSSESACVGDKYEKSDDDYFEYDLRNVSVSSNAECEQENAWRPPTSTQRFTVAWLVSVLSLCDKSP